MSARPERHGPKWTIGRSEANQLPTLGTVRVDVMGGEPGRAAGRGGRDVRAGADLLTTKPHRTPAPPEAPLQRLGRYRPLRTLGRGGMGRVDLAEDLVLKRLVAVKVLLADPADLGSRERFLREARTLANLRHPHIVPILDVGEEGGQHWFAMEYVEGRTLAGLIEEGLRPEAAVRLVAKVARAIQHAHEAGVIHRDLKPANVLVDGEGEPRVVDFGLARRVEVPGSTGLSRSGALIGTPAYMAPEQARGEVSRIDERTDVWALGVILYEALTGRRAYEGTQYDILTRIVLGDSPSLERDRAVLGRDLETIVARAAAKEPARRYGSAAELAEDLERWLAGDPIRARPIPVLRRLHRWLGRHGRLAAAAGSLLAGVALAASVRDWTDRESRAAEAQARWEMAREDARERRADRARQARALSYESQDLERAIHEALRAGMDLGGCESLEARWRALEERSLRFGAPVDPAEAERASRRIDLALGRALLETGRPERLAEAEERLDRALASEQLSSAERREARLLQARLVAARLPGPLAAWPGPEAPELAEPERLAAGAALDRLDTLLEGLENEEATFDSDLVRARLSLLAGRPVDAGLRLVPWRARVKDWAARDASAHRAIFELYRGLVAAAAADPTDLVAVAKWYRELRLVLSDPEAMIDPRAIVPVAYRSAQAYWTRWLDGPEGEDGASLLAPVRDWLDHARSVSTYVDWPADLPWMLGVAQVELGDAAAGEVWLAQALEGEDFVPEAEPRIERSSLLKAALERVLSEDPSFEEKWRKRCPPRRRTVR